jgi:hypothetical protein
MKDKTKLVQQIIVAMQARVPHLAPRDRVGAALAVLEVPRIRAALELQDLKGMAHAKEATADEDRLDRQDDLAPARYRQEDHGEVGPGA